MLTIFIRAIIIFLTVLVALRLMGKRQISEMQPFEFAITLIIADLACLPMQDVSIPLLYGLIGIFAIFFVQMVISHLNKKSMIMRGMVSAKANVIITPFGIDFQQLNNQGLTISDLEESMRISNCFSFADIEYGILETNGKMSFMQRPNTSPSLTLSFSLISVGKIDNYGLKYLKVTKESLSEILKFLEVELKNVLVLTLDNKGNVYYQEKFKQYIVTTINMEDYVE